MEALGQTFAGIVGFCESTVGDAIERLIVREGRVVRAGVERAVWSAAWIAVAALMAALGATCAVGAMFLFVETVAGPVVAALASAGAAFAAGGLAAMAARRGRTGTR